MIKSFFRRVALRILGYKEVKIKDEQGRLISCFRPYPDDEVITAKLKEERLEEVRFIPKKKQ